MKKGIAVLSLTIVFLTALMCQGAAALAEKQEKVYQDLYYGAESEDVFAMQVILYNLGYFEAGETYTPGTLDSTTNWAIQRFCDDNGIDLKDKAGIPASVQKFLIEGSPRPRATEAPETPSPTPDNQPTPYPGPMDNNVIVNVQNALSRKGYYSGLEAYISGTFDAPTKEAVRRFCAIINRSYNEQEGIPEDLYINILAEDAPVYTPPTPTPFSIIQYKSQDPVVREVQNRLKELDYFRDYGDPLWDVYDDPTVSAIARFCEVNNVAPNPYGIDEELYTKLMDKDALKNPVDRHELHRNDQSQEVVELQARLYNLGYYTGRSRTGAYDGDMDAALADFARINYIQYDGQTLTVAMQDAIFDEKAAAYTPPAAEKAGIGEALAGTVSFLGIRMPLFMMILLIAVILAGLVFLIIRTFFPGKETAKNQSAAGLSTGSSWPSSQASALGGGRLLNLEISYHGSTNQTSVSMDKPLRIGRNERTLPLNPSDSDISRQHCQMYFRGSTLILRDYSTNGTDVNYQTYHNCECVVHSGDRIKIGNHEITVRY